MYISCMYVYQKFGDAYKISYYDAPEITTAEQPILGHYPRHLATTLKNNIITPHSHYPGLLTTGSNPGCQLLFTLRWSRDCTRRIILIMYKTSAQYNISVFYSAPIGAMQLKAAKRRTSPIRCCTIVW